MLIYLFFAEMSEILETSYRGTFDKKRGGDERKEERK